MGDVFAYAERVGIEMHPLHEKGYPSIGDAHSTVPVDREKWFEYAGERSGRFVGLTNKDGSAKSECGIHSEGADGKEREFERDLWLPERGSIIVEATAEGLPDLLADGGALLVVYAPWCPFCQAMEEGLEGAAEALSAEDGVRTLKLRGDTIRDVVSAPPL